MNWMERVKRKQNFAQQGAVSEVGFFGRSKGEKEFEQVKWRPVRNQVFEDS